MKTLKYFVITALLISGLSSCLIERPGYYHSRPHRHHYHGHGHGRY